MGRMYETPLCWGNRVSPQFRSFLRSSAARLGVEANYLMACMAFETGRTFDPAIRNAAGSGAVGLIQFMPSTAAALGTTTEALAALSAVQQIKYVELYFRPWKSRLKSLSDVYMTILWPGAIGKPESYVLFDKADPKHPKRYIQNAGLDLDRNGQITKREATDGVARMLTLGLRNGNVYEDQN